MARQAHATAPWRDKQLESHIAESHIAVNSLARSRRQNECARRQPASLHRVAHLFREVVCADAKRLRLVRAIEVNARLCHKRQLVLFNSKRKARIEREQTRVGHDEDVGAGPLERLESGLLNPAVNLNLKVAASILAKLEGASV